MASSVRPTEIACREHRGGHELDIVVTEEPGAASRSGFTPDLTAEAAERPDVELVSLDRIYQGS